MKYILTTVLLLFVSITALAQTTDKEEVVETLEAFEQAIVDNNQEAASKLLLDEVRIVEGSAIETKEEYVSHHFHSDGKFLKEMNRSTNEQTIFIEGKVAWVTTKTHMQGAYNEGELNLNSMELAVLKREADIWKIAALHWSSSERN